MEAIFHIKFIVRFLKNYLIQLQKKGCLRQLNKLIFFWQNFFLRKKELTEKSELGFICLAANYSLTLQFSLQTVVQNLIVYRYVCLLLYQGMYKQTESSLYCTCVRCVHKDCSRHRARFLDSSARDCSAHGKGQRVRLISGAGILNSPASSDRLF